MLFIKTVKDKWIVELKYYKEEDETRDGVIYAVARCAACGMEYHNKATIDSMHVYVPDDATKEEENEVIIEAANIVLIRINRFPFPSYCEHCGMYMDHDFKDEWVSFHEQKPLLSGRYMVTVKNGKYGNPHTEIMNYDLVTETWHSDAFSPFGSQPTVIAWKVRPHPYIPPEEVLTDD